MKRGDYPVTDGRTEDVAENQRVPVCRGMKGMASGLAGMSSEDTALNCLLACSCVERGEKLERKKNKAACDKQTRRGRARHRW